MRHKNVVQLYCLQCTVIEDQFVKLNCLLISYELPVQLVLIKIVTLLPVLHLLDLFFPYILVDLLSLHNMSVFFLLKLTVLLIIFDTCLLYTSRCV